MGKQTHKLKGLGDVATIIAAAPSLTAAARQLGVDRSTIHRWIESGKAKRPGRAPRKRRLTKPPRAGQSPAAWARWVRRSYEIDGTDQVLLDLAVQALKLARDVKEPPAVCLAAMARYQMLIKQLNLDGEGEKAEQKPAAPQRREPVAQRRTGIFDPRSVLMAVK